MFTEVEIEIKSGDRSGDDFLSPLVFLPTMPLLLTTSGDKWR